ncbi:hypothetical protein BAC1_02197 [uncultured bacterium]|nr:hypothetical protein BAC1_02197 [uncultured bacterium]
MPDVKEFNSCLDYLGVDDLRKRAVQLEAEAVIMRREIKEKDNRIRELESRCVYKENLLLELRIVLMALCDRAGEGKK